MQLVDRASPAGGEVVSLLVQHPQCIGVLVGHDRAAFTLECSDAGRSGSVDPIGFAAAAAGQFPHPRSRSGRHIQHHFTARDEPSSQMASEPSAFSTAHRRCGHRLAHAINRRYSTRVASIRIEPRSAFVAGSTAVAV
jgi:hypothetical protein